MLSRFSFLLVIAFCISFAPPEDPNLHYIEANLPLAMQEQARAGIPVSIKLGQAILESDGGKSVLAKRANNHFGIKCKSYWSGPRYFYTDDDKDSMGNLVPSCFRMYSSIDESYRDHSNFLRHSERYSALFDLPEDDYAAWAHTLSRSGYATNSAYAVKLIEIIERYGLHKLDKATENSANY